MQDEARFARWLPFALAAMLAALVWIGRDPGPGVPLSEATTGGTTPDSQGVQGEQGEQAQRAGTPAAGSARTELARDRSRRTHISGHVEGLDGEPLAGLLVQVDELRGSPGRVGYERVPVARRRSSSDGGFEVAVWSGRRYAVAIDSYRHEPRELIVPVQADDRPVVGVVLRPLPGAGEVRGTVRSETGTWHGEVRLSLAPERRLPTWFTSVRWEQQSNGRWIGRFAFEDVPWDHYACRLEPADDDVAEWTALQLSARPPAAGLEFVRLDREPNVDLNFHAYDQFTGEPIEDFELCLSYESGLRPAQCRRGLRGLDLLEVPRNQRLRWSLSASGYEPCSGGLGEAYELGRDCGPELRFSIPLRREQRPSADGLGPVLDARRSSPRVAEASEPRGA